MTHGIRKQIYDLTLEDLHQHPVWEFASDEEGIEGQDEATVRPLAHFAQATGVCVVRTKFILADTTVMYGHSTVDDGDDYTFEDAHPSIVIGNDQVGFHFGIFQPSNEVLQRQYDLLGKSSEQVFPLKFESDINQQESRHSGTIEAFYYIKKGFFSSKLTPIV